MSLPRLVLTGNVVDEPKLAFTNSGLPVLNFRVACNERKKQDDGTWVDAKSCFLSVQAWGKMAENTAESIHKGSLVSIVGKLAQRDFERQDGTKGTAFEVTADDIAVSLDRQTATVHKMSRSDAPAASTEAPPW